MAKRRSPSKASAAAPPDLPISETELLQIEELFRGLIRSRAREGSLALPEELPCLSGLRATREEPAWFPVPGMYGGFAYWIEQRQDGARLISRSWCRVVGGSGMHHEISPTEIRL